MSEEIAPALTPEEWALRLSGQMSDEVRNLNLGDGIPIMDSGHLAVTYDTGYPQPVEMSQLPAVIALANAALPDSDRRKITRAWVKALREASVVWASGNGVIQDDEQTARVHAIADALASYLPPEGS